MFTCRDVWLRIAILTVMVSFAFLFLWVIASVATTTTTTTTTTTIGTSRCGDGDDDNDCDKNKNEFLIFQDEFDNYDNDNNNGNLDFLDTWHHEITMDGGGNREFQAYVNNRHNSYIDNGMLVLRPTFTADMYGDDGEDYIEHGIMNLTNQGCQSPSHEYWNCIRQATTENLLPPVLSAKVDTKDSFSFTYGRVEVKAKLPSADWTWPAIWLLPRDSVYGPWPRSGEIDLMESRGNTNYRDPQTGQSLGNDVVGSTLNWGPAPNRDGWPLTHSQMSVPTTTIHKQSKNSWLRLPHWGSGRGDDDDTTTTTFHDAFHTFGLYWSDTELYTYLDHPSQVMTRVYDYGQKSFWQMGVDAGWWSTNDTMNCW